MFAALSGGPLNKKNMKNYTKITFAEVALKENFRPAHCVQQSFNKTSKTKARPCCLDKVSPVKFDLQQKVYVWR